MTHHGEDGGSALHLTRRGMLGAGSATVLAAGLPGIALSRESSAGLTFTGPVPVTATSKPWGSAMDGGVREAMLRAYDFIEEEYFLSGTANVYGPGESLPSATKISAFEYSKRLAPLARLLRSDLPFTTRIVVIRPRDMTKFSGMVHMVPLHNLDGTSYTEKNLMRNGDVWMGLEVNGGTRFGVEERPSGGVVNLRNFDAGRYGKLSIPAGLTTDWPDLQPGRLGAAFKNLDFGSSGQDANIFVQEISRSYAQAPDIITKMAEALRSNAPGNPLQGHKVRRICTAGRSGQSTILAPYVDHHHARAVERFGRVPFDAYMIRVGTLPLHRPAGSLLIMVQSEAEAPMFNDSLWRFADSEHPMTRYYEIPGVGHGLTSRPNVSGRIGHVVPKGVRGISDIEGETPYQPYDKISLPLVWGMWRNAYDYLEKGIPMPRCARIDRDPSQPDGLARDAMGNATGGVRLPWMNFPDARYVGVIHKKNPLEGGMMPFDAARMKQLYGSNEAYLKKLDGQLEDMVRNRLIEARDVPLMRKRGVSAALALGFEDYAGDAGAGLSPTL